MKEFGCNKMTCSVCKGVFCYVCKQDVTHATANGYNHFGPDRCVLYDHPARDRHEREAREAEEEAIMKIKAMDADLDEDKLRIDTGKAKDPAPHTDKMQNLINHPAGGVFMRDLNNQERRPDPRQLHMQNLQAQVNQFEALRPAREIGEIVAAVRGMNQAFDMNNIPPPEVRLQQLQQLQELQRRTQAARNAQPRP
jgi:hypothetical protein